MGMLRYEESSAVRADSDLPPPLVRRTYSMEFSAR